MHTTCSARSRSAIVRDAGGKRLVLTVFVDRTGRIDHTTLQPPAPETLTDAKRPSACDAAVQNAYVRAFLDRYVRGRDSRLLAGPSPRWPQVSIRQRKGIEH